MEAYEALVKRVSHARLGEPAPSAEQLERLFRVALRAPDHGQLRPWRFLTVQGEARVQLGELFAQATRAAQPDASPEALTKARAMPLRAPTLVVAIARLLDHPKVPEIEQMLAAGCAAHGVVQAAFVEGLGAMWRTGALAFDARVREGLGLAANERIVGFIYLGTPLGELRQPPALDPADFVSAWQG